MRYLVLLLLLLPTLALPSPRSTRIILVVPPGETLTDAEQIAYRQYAEGALGWWGGLAPEPVSQPLGATEIITPGVDVYHNLSSWSLPYLQENNPGATLFLIDNSESLSLLFGDSGGETQQYYGGVWVVMNGVPDPEAVTAHELGHAIYYLDHPAGCGTTVLIDIMCYQSLTYAYRTRTIGCVSLAQLDAPCVERRTYLPMMMR